MNFQDEPQFAKTYSTPEKQKKSVMTPKEIVMLLRDRLLKHGGSRVGALKTADFRTAREITKNNIVISRILYGDKDINAIGVGNLYIPHINNSGTTDGICMSKVSFNYGNKEHFLYAIYLNQIEIVDTIINTVQGGYVYVLINKTTHEIVKIKVENITNAIYTNLLAYIRETESVCFDCKDELDKKERHRFNNKVYCTSCYSEVTQVCDECGKKEKDSIEFVPVFIEHGGKQKLITLCVKCCKEVAQCASSYCKINVRKSDDTCES